MVVTSAQCVAHAMPAALRMLTGNWNGAAHNFSRVHIHGHFEPNTLNSDVALLQLQNASAVAAENVRPISLDWQQQAWSNCLVSFAHNATNGLTQTVSFADIHRPCGRFGARNLTSCTVYPLADASICAVSVSGGVVVREVECV